MNFKEEFVSKLSGGQEVIYAEKREYEDARRFVSGLLDQLSNAQISIDGFRETADKSLTDCYVRVDECVFDLIATLHECPGRKLGDNYGQEDF